MKEHEEVASDEGVFLINYSVPLLNMSIAEVTNISVSSFVFKVEERDGNGMKYISEVNFVHFHYDHGMSSKLLLQVRLHQLLCSNSVLCILPGVFSTISQ